MRGVAAPAPLAALGSVGASELSWNPHCWQNENPSGVDPPQRVQRSVPPCPATSGGAAGEAGDATGPPGGGDITGPGGANGAGGFGLGGANGLGAGIPDGGGVIGAPTGALAGTLTTGPLGAYAGAPGAVAASAVPQLRQNFMPGGFSPRQAAQIAGNPGPGPGVCAGAAANAEPQFKQNDDPGGLWWPQAEQRSIKPLLDRVSRKRTRWEMGRGAFATGGASC